MSQTETISGAMVLRLVLLMRESDVPVEAHLAAVGLSSALLSSSSRVSYAAADHLFEAAAKQIGQNHLGLSLALTKNEESYGPAGLLLVTGSTFRQGLTRCLAFQRLWGDGERFTLRPLEDGAALCFRHPGKSLLAGAIAAECALVEILEGVRALVEPDAVPLEVAFTHAALGNTTLLAEHFGIEPQFEQTENRISFSSSLMDRPMHVLRDLLSEALERQAARALSLLPSRDTYLARTRMLLTGEQGLRRSLPEVASTFRVSARTLQRRLRQEGTTFEQLLDEARRSEALALEQQGAPAKEISVRLGFQDVSALSRAKRRWTRK